MNRLRLLLFGLPLLVGTAAVVWSGLGLPPAYWIVKYGPAPGCEPEGVETVEGVEFVVIGPGICRIGSAWLAEQEKWNLTAGDPLGRITNRTSLPWGEKPAASWEMPVHYVEFPRGFAIARTEITNAQYEAFDPDHQRSESSKGDRDPVVNVSFDDAKAYCAWLAEKSGRPVRLPSESEWECACRAGGAGEYAFGDDAADLGEYAWYGENSDGRAHQVATKKANAWGIHDLHGNVWEWCEDLWHDSYVVTGPVVQPDGKTMDEVLSRPPPDGTAWLYDEGSSDRVFRGGGWNGDPVSCRSAIRNWYVPGYRWWNLGFRPAMGD